MARWFSLFKLPNVEAKAVFGLESIAPERAVLFGWRASRMMNFFIPVWGQRAIKNKTHDRALRQTRVCFQHMAKCYTASFVIFYYRFDNVQLSQRSTPGSLNTPEDRIQTYIMLSSSLFSSIRFKYSRSRSDR